MPSTSKSSFRIPKRKSDASAADTRETKPKIDDADAASPEVIDLETQSSSAQSEPTPSEPAPSEPPPSDPAQSPVESQTTEPAPVVSAIPPGWLEWANGGVTSSLHGLCAIKTPLSAEHTAHLPKEAPWTPMNAVMACGGRKVRDSSAHLPSRLACKPPTRPPSPPGR